MGMRGYGSRLPLEQQPRAGLPLAGQAGAGLEVQDPAGEAGK